MILRSPVISDYTFVYECYQDWPLDSKGPVTMDRAIGFTRRWMYRTDETCLIGVDDVPVGLVTYRRGMFTAFIDNLIVHPSKRQLGYSTDMLRALKDELVADGVVVAEFKTLPGIIREQIGARYIDAGDGMGRITWDMEL